MSTAREEAERRWPEIDTSTGGSILQSYAERYAMRRSGFVEGAEWQASREPTEAEVETTAKNIADYNLKACMTLGLTVGSSPMFDWHNYVGVARDLLVAVRKAVTR